MKNKRQMPDKTDSKRAIQREKDRQLLQKILPPIDTKSILASAATEQRRRKRRWIMFWVLVLLLVGIGAFFL